MKPKIYKSKPTDPLYRYRSLPWVVVSFKGPWTSYCPLPTWQDAITHAFRYSVIRREGAD